MHQRLWQIMGGAQPDHMVVVVRQGMMIGATSFFVDQLGWTEEVARRVSGGWGQARFVQPPMGGVWVQLTELAADPGGWIEGTHIGLQVSNPAEAAKVIEAFAAYVAIGCEIEPANDSGTKWFVALELFWTKIELVP